MNILKLFVIRQRLQELGVVVFSNLKKFDFQNRLTHSTLLKTFQLDRPIQH
jgi:hypothetical protein